jgi:hypothetical protein
MQIFVRTLTGNGLVDCHARQTFTQEVEGQRGYA